MNEIKTVVNGNYNELSGLLSGLVYYEVVTLASNITISANSNYGSGTQQKTISARAGYKPIMVVPQNVYNKAVNLWYCNLYSDTQINWRCSNNTSSQVTGITLEVRVLYIKTSAWTA